MNYVLARRLELLREVGRLQESLDVPGDVSYTCETAGHFYLYQVRQEACVCGSVCAWHAQRHYSVDNCHPRSNVSIMLKQGVLLKFNFNSDRKFPYL